MKSIKLTKEHKNRLLEMCKTLFPEWKAHSLITDEQYISDDSGDFSESDETFKIHWFEFCMTHLIDKLELEYASIVFLTENHPVDCLYEEFKKIKK
jgi:hypothetical protein